MSHTSRQETQPPQKPCRKCETFWGIFGIAAGVAVLFIGVDLATHGGLTRLLTGSRRLATITPLRTVDDDRVS